MFQGLQQTASASKHRADLTHRENEGIDSESFGNGGKGGMGGYKCIRGRYEFFGAVVIEFIHVTYAPGDKRPVPVFCSGKAGPGDTSCSAAVCVACRVSPYTLRQAPSVLALFSVFSASFWAYWYVSSVFPFVGLLSNQHCGGRWSAPIRLLHCGHQRQSGGDDPKGPCAQRCA